MLSFFSQTHNLHTSLATQSICLGMCDATHFIAIVLITYVGQSTLFDNIVFDIYLQHRFSVA